MGPCEDTSIRRILMASDVSSGPRHSFFQIDPDNGSMYHPTLHSQGPWAENMLHGRVISGLIAYEAELNLQNEVNMLEWQIARITVDMFRVAPMAPLMVEVQFIRSGRRIKVLDVEILTERPESGKVLIAKGLVVALKKSMSPLAKVWTPSRWPVEYPEKTDSQHASDVDDNMSSRPHIWETINVTDGDVGDNRISRKYGVRRAWIRETIDLVQGIVPSPLVRVAQVADIANPVANSSEEALHYINVDITLYLNRNPISEWVGVETLQHGSTDGISIGAISLYDIDGLVGTSAVSGLAQAPSA